MKTIIIKFFYTLQFYKIIIFKKLLTSEYVVNSLKFVYKTNIEKLLSYYGAKIGKNCHFKGWLQVDNHKFGNKLFENLHISDNCYIGKNVYFDLANDIDIKNDVVISNDVKIITHADVGNRKMSKYYHRVSKKIIIGEGSWIGAGSIILPGVTIGKYCIIAAGSIVNKNVEDYNMVAGNPAVVKKRIIK